MLIPIITTCKEPGSVPPYVLDRMLACGEIHAFERSTGWVMVGRDPIRAARTPYHGHERRRSVSFRMHTLIV
jgi:hypothetical protein